MESVKKRNDEIIKLNVGGYKFSTTSSTISKCGSNFLSNLINGKIPSLKDEEGYIFIDRNGKNFEIILDYLRNGILLIPPTISLKSVIVEASFYSLSMDSAFLGEIKDGVYGELHSGQRTSIVYIERCKDEPWSFGFTGILTTEDNGKQISSVEFWKEVGSIVEGRIILRNYIISCDSGDLKIIQSDRLYSPFKLKCISKKTVDSGLELGHNLTGEWWTGDKFVDGVSLGNYVQLAFANIEADKWVCHIKCDQHKSMSVQQFELLTENWVNC